MGTFPQMRGASQHLQVQRRNVGVVSSRPHCCGSGGGGGGRRRHRSASRRGYRCDCLPDGATASHWASCVCRNSSLQASRLTSQKHDNCTQLTFSTSGNTSMCCKTLRQKVRKSAIRDFRPRDSLSLSILNSCLLFHARARSEVRARAIAHGSARAPAPAPVRTSRARCVQSCFVESSTQHSPWRALRLYRAWIPVNIGSSSSSSEPQQRSQQH